MRRNHDAGTGIPKQRGVDFEIKIYKVETHVVFELRLRHGMRRNDNSQVTNQMYFVVDTDYITFGHGCDVTGSRW